MIELGPPAPELASVVIQTAELLDALGDVSDEEVEDQVQKLVACVGDAAGQHDHEGRLSRVRDRVAGPQMAREALATLRGLTSPRVILLTAPAAICASSDLSRAVLSVPEDGSLVARSVHFDGDPQAAQDALTELAALPVRLARPVAEGDAVRRRRTTVVDIEEGARIDARWATVMGWRRFAVAPILQGNELVGVLHADAGRAPVTVEQADMLWGFVRGLAQLHEGVTLRQALRLERQRTRELVEWLDSRAAALDESRLVLDSGLEAPPRHEPTPVPGASDAVVFDGILTRRELEVLRLVSAGRTNREIAEDLVVTTGTVKFHVRRLLAKLHVSNRAEAVARYYALLDAGAR